MNPNALPAGAILNSGKQTYRIVRELGSGGFGITYLAVSRQKVGNITVPIQFAVKEHFMSDFCERDSDTLQIKTGPGRQTVENSMKDFLGEARRLQQVGDGHPSIVKVNEVFEANNTAYYVMEYLEGESLRSYVRSRGKLTEAETLDLLRPVMEAVDYLHEQRMTHLDIKPDNIMLAREEDASGNAVMRPVLIDFGLSKHYDASGHATSTVNTLGCSDGYAPLEQYAGITTFSPSADIYALAATVLFCLTGKDPRRSPDMLHVDIPSWLASLTPPLTPALKSLLAASLSPLPTDRPASMLTSEAADVASHTDEGNKTVKLPSTTKLPTRRDTPSRQEVPSSPDVAGQEETPAPFCAPREVVPDSETALLDEPKEGKMKEERSAAMKFLVLGIVVVIIVVISFIIQSTSSGNDTSMEDNANYGVTTADVGRVLAKPVLNVHDVSTQQIYHGGERYTAGWGERGFGLFGPNYVYGVSESDCLVDRYNNGDDFSEGLAPVQKDAGGGWGAIDAKGRLVIDYQYLDKFQFRNGVAVVKTPEGFGVINQKNEFVVDPQPCVIDPFNDRGQAAVWQSNQIIGYITTSGHWLSDK